MRLASALLAAVVFLAGCPRDPAPAQGQGPKVKIRQCKTTDDCDKGWICLDGACADMRSKAIYTAPETAVTPDKVRREVEQKLKQQERRLDELPTQ